MREVCALSGKGGWMAGRTKSKRARERDGVTRVRDHGIWRVVGRAAVVGRFVRFEVLSGKHLMNSSTALHFLSPPPLPTHTYRSAYDR